jgi:general secretion pathway protein E
VRRLCKYCSEIYELLPEVVDEFELRRFVGEDKITMHRAIGCEQCEGIGYKGRLAILEFLLMSDAIKKLIMAHSEAGIIQKTAIAEGMVTMRDDGLVKALDGITTLEEVIRVTAEA